MTSRLLIGHVLDRLAELPEASVHCAVCSPPYWGLRSYGTEPQVWGGDPAHSHTFEDTGYAGFNPGGQNYETSALGDAAITHLEKRTRKGSMGEVCSCGAWLGELGLEPTPALFIEHLVEVFRAVRRVLRPDGTLWLNLGDSYAGSGKGPSNSFNKSHPHSHEAQHPGSRNIAQIAKGQAPTARLSVPAEAKPKDLLMIPARAALALQADGWWLRSHIVWAKKSCMPESVTDRPTNAWESIFLLSPSRRYFYDAEAVKEEGAWDGQSGHRTGPRVVPTRTGPPDMGLAAIEPGSRNLRNVWHLGPEPLKQAHYAAYPTEIPRRAILAGTSAKGCCAECGAPWRRLVERTKMVVDHSDRVAVLAADGLRTQTSGTMVQAPSSRTVGWEPTCTHRGEPVPCTVLDPFAGSGTTLLVADRLGRDSIGIDLNPEYVHGIAVGRVGGEAPLFTELEVVA